MWILYVVIILFLILLIFAKLILNLIFGKRCEGNSNLKYLTADDFKELNAKKIEFKSNKGQVLRGNLYMNSNIDKFKGLIIFVHGMGAGHLSYTTQINTFAKNGFLVLSYDNTGTCTSDGKKLNGFFQSVIDLDYALKFVKENEELNKYNISLVGHSWGAYTVCQVLQFNHNIKSVVAFSGPNNSSTLICDLMGNGKINFRFLKPFFDLVNILTFGLKSVINTTKILKNTDVPVLLLHGELDTTCSIKNSLVSNTEMFNDNIKVILFKDKFHNVYQTNKSEGYLNEIFGKINELNKKYKGEELKEKISPLYESIDYEKITEEDENVMNTVIGFLNRE